MTPSEPVREAETIRRALTFGQSRYDVDDKAVDAFDALAADRDRLAGENKELRRHFAAEELAAIDALSDSKKEEE